MTPKPKPKPEPKPETDNRLLLLSPGDNVLVLRGVIESGEEIYVCGIAVVAKKQINIGHKMAAMDIATGAKILKYGAPIGSATSDIKLGDHVHINNIKSDYTPTYALDEKKAEVEMATDRRKK